MRKKLNKSSLVSIQIIDKSSVKYRVIRTIGSSHDPTQVDRLLLEGKQWIEACKGELTLDLDDVQQKTDQLFDNIKDGQPVGAHLLLGKIFDQVGFNQIESALVISRIAYPASKLKTTDYWRDWIAVQILFYEDKLNIKKRQK